ncbi:Os03g0212950 [Oryza sativa Japonica Group]|uniref:Os03g0212950 protein n=1 Tax=Oryza sativa subsp. japonica TaxID=39947 RepID=A0A0P0VUL2_ORYSJ|nr:hypothetical protein EE612_016082 [Oryza sativa]BAS82934.1 Os03g0212950 [Oryza sativa Japonica Group]
MEMNGLLLIHALTVFSDVHWWAVVPFLDIVHQAPHPSGHNVQPYRICLRNNSTPRFKFSADGAGVCQGVVEQCPDDVGVVVPRVVGGVVVYADEIQRPLDDGGLIRREPRQPLPHPRPHRRRVGGEESLAHHPS